MAESDERNPSRGTQAINAFEQADRVDARPRVQWGQDVQLKEEARFIRTHAQTLLEPSAKVVQGAGEAVEWHPEADPDRVIETFVDTLQRPTSVAVGASEKRTARAT